MIDFPPELAPTHESLPRVERPLWTAGSSDPVPPLLEVHPVVAVACAACQLIGAHAAARCGHYWRPRTP